MVASLANIYEAHKVQPNERDRAVMVAKVLLRAPNIDLDSDMAVLARQFLRALKID